MKLYIVSRSYEKVEQFFHRQGSFEIVGSCESLSNNLDRLMSSIIRVDKFIIIVSADSADFASEVRALLALLSNSGGLLRIGELAFFFKHDMNATSILSYIDVVADFIKTRSADDVRWVAPTVTSHELSSLSFDVIYKELLGKSSSRVIDPNVQLLYREERGSESRAVFSPSDEVINLLPYDHSNVQHFTALKDLLKKTESPANLQTLEALLPEYESLKLQEYKELGYTRTKWILMSGDRKSGTSTHATALVASAVRAGKSVMVLDFSESGDIVEFLRMASLSHYIAQSAEFLDNSIVLVEDEIIVYTEHSRDIVRTLLPYVQARPNVIDRDIVIVMFDLDRMPLVLGSVNHRLCSIILSSMLFPASVSKLFSIDTAEIPTLVWLNDNMKTPLRCTRYTPDTIRTRSKEAGKRFKFLEPIEFADFDVDAEFCSTVLSAL